jgi:hypothetical protein
MRRNRKFSTTISKRFETLGFVKKSIQLLRFEFSGVDCRGVALKLVRVTPRRSTDGNEVVNFLVTKRQPGTPPGCYSVSDLLSIQMLHSIVNCCSVRLQIISAFLRLSGDEGTRTPGLRLAKAALSQLSYIPRVCLVQEWA